MRLGVDATCWANVRGYGRFTRELCTAMVALSSEHEFVFFADAAAARVFELRAPNARLVTVTQKVAPTQAAAADRARSALDMLRLTRAVSAERLDAFFSPSVYTFFPLPPRLRALVCIHDCIAERYPELTLPSRRARVFWRAKVRFALWQARLVLTVSDYSARDLARVLRVPASKIRVSTEAPARAYRPSESAEDIARAAAEVGLPAGARWFMYVGGFNPHKNVAAIVRALHAISRGHGDDPHLVLVGPTSSDVFHGEQGHIHATVRELGLESRVHWAGYVPDEELRLLHCGALALAIPSQCEGFGLPAVEAAACGTPVIATTESPLPELLADGGLFVEPGRLEPLAAAMRSLADDRAARARLGGVALERARALTWPKGAQAALDALVECSR
ncbi:MAG: glycosyltransferase family 4 protein [Planctomycetes bacterium]|nr:glycosyltransferase family 4 protein [Planctomycetota bacterium]